MNKQRAIGVLFYDFSIPGGGPKVATNVFNALSELGYEKIIFISVFMKYSCQSYSHNEKIKFYYLNQGEGHLINTFFFSLKTLDNIISENNVGLVIANGYSVDLLCSIVSIKHRIPMIHWEHTSLENRYYNDDFVSKLYRLIGVIVAKKIVALTEKNKRSFINKYNLNEEKVAVIPNWMDNFETCNNYNSKSHIILTVGRADPVKGFDRLVEVAARVYKGHEDWEWQIWGDFDNSYGESVKAAILKSRLNKFVKIMGTTHNIQDVYKNGAFLVLTSYYEGLPMALLEAKQFKLPLISFDINTGPDEIIEDGVNGFLIRDNDIEDMTVKIKHLMDDIALRENFSENSVLGLKKFDKSQIINLWIDLLKQYIE